MHERQLRRCARRQRIQKRPTRKNVVGSFLIGVTDVELQYYCNTSGMWAYMGKTGSCKIKTDTATKLGTQVHYDDRS